MVDDLKFRAHFPPRAPKVQTEARSPAVRKFKGILVSTRRGRKEDARHVTYLQIKVYEEQRIFDHSLGSEVELIIG